MTAHFGTDGIRAPAPVLIELARPVGSALARACRSGVLGRTSARPQIVIGRDTRPSGPDIEAELISGLTSGGADVLRAGVIPTAGVAFLTSKVGADAGVVVSASHNPAPDNGIKLFGAGGWKLDADIEAQIEALVEAPHETVTAGSATQLDDAIGSYVTHLAGTVDADLSGMRVVADCANGAASFVVPEVLRRLGVDATLLFADGDGRSINDGCGATHPGVIAEAARSGGAVGLTFDGDADRVIAADETGAIVDGDGIVALVASDMRSRGALVSDTIAVTVMSNQALRSWCDSEHIKILETSVGDRNILRAMRSGGFVLGGEQSGHIIRLDRSTTGDGILIGLNVLGLVASSGRRLADIVPFRPMPQVLVNVAWEKGRRLDDSDGVKHAIDEAQRVLGSEGRVFVRPSGTEPLVRVMAEASDRDRAVEAAETVAAALRTEAKGS